MIKKLALTVLGVLLVAGALVGTKVQQFRALGAAGAHHVRPPTVVTSAAVRETQWERTLSATGSLVATQGVTVRSETPGKIVRLGFESGDSVSTGDVLVVLDTATEEAQLRSAQAAAALAKANLARSRDLRARKGISPAELDAANAQFKQAAAEVEKVRTAIAKKTVRAPFSGRLGMRTVNLGQVLKENDPIASLQTLDPIYVDFTLPQRQLAVLERGTPIRVTTDAAPGTTYNGTINAVNAVVDATTRNVWVRGVISNRNRKLRAGMFARVEVVLPAPEKVLAIPATAVLFAPYGDSVFVIEATKGPEGTQSLTVRQRFVRLGESRGDYVAVERGLTAGERVVSSGAFKLRSAMPVVIDNTLAPPAELAPRPDNT